ncbi:hypothetical protein [uncultured Sulfitobacter sp.]|uniref:hypothetical protein n=1 Tax=uncultured Sulfitobacter sp. TaxID=191468 RepID=UPI00261AD9DE|nr:hypothetical protein [uncultured Sulfitobacter sp.]
MDYILKLPVFLFASAVSLGDGRKDTFPSALNAMPFPAEAHTQVTHLDGSEKTAGGDIRRNNLAAKLSGALTASVPEGDGRPIAGLSRYYWPSDV